jgi:hypothetical protein
VFLEDSLVGFSIGAGTGELETVLARYAGHDPTSGATDLRQSGELERFPVTSEVWMYGNVERLLADHSSEANLGGFRFGNDWLQGSEKLRATVHSSPLHLAMELRNECDSAATAERIAGWAKLVLAALRAAEEQSNPAESDAYGPVLDAVIVSQENDSVSLRWESDARLLAQLAEQLL